MGNGARGRWEIVPFQRGKRRRAVRFATDIKRTLSIWAEAVRRRAHVTNDAF